MAQWIAQRTEVVTPSASQLIFEDMTAKIGHLQHCCKCISLPEQY